jgi:hypothetical protein
MYQPTNPLHPHLNHSRIALLRCLAVTLFRPPIWLLTRSFFLSPFQSFLRQPTGLARLLSQNLDPL